MFTFIQPATLLPSSAPSQRVCRRRPPVLASASGANGEPSWEQTSNYETLGSGVPSSGVQRIEFIIRQDGTVEETVTGVRGKNCEKITEKIEKALGKVVHTEKTEEYFEQAVDQVVEKNVVKEGVDWPGADGLPTW